MTEDEARTKWCPWARVFFPDAAGNRIPDTGKPLEGAKCIASACMMGVDDKGEWLGFCGRNEWGAGL